MFKLIAIIGYIFLLWGIIKYWFNIKVLKGNKQEIEKRYDKHGPFFDVVWEEDKCENKTHMK